MDMAGRGGMSTYSTYDSGNGLLAPGMSGMAGV
jgi:hypothetical protein